QYRGDEAVATFQQALAILRGIPDAGDDIARVCAKALRMIAERSGTFRRQPPADVAQALLDEGLSFARDPEARAWLFALSGHVAGYWTAFADEDPILVVDRIRLPAAGIALAERLGRIEFFTLYA